MSKNILITGCSTGFGFDAAVHLARKGHRVHATMRGVDGKNRAPANALREMAGKEDLALAVGELDVTSDASVAAAVADLPTQDVLINNAGLGYGGPVEPFTSAELTAQLDVNVVGTLRVARAVLPGMRAARSGLVIQVSSIAGRLTLPGFGIYHASKWGLEGLSETLRYELAPLGIDVALVEPGPFSTSFFDNLVGPTDGEVAAAYGHVAAFGESFKAQVTQAFEDPAVVIGVFEALIDAPPGKRPLRTVAGLDFGTRGLNDAVEPLRRQLLESVDLASWDGVSAG